MPTLIVLVSVFLTTLILIKAIKKQWNINFSGRFAMSVMLIFTAASHFVFIEGMTMLLPEFIPFRREIIYFTAFLEIAAAVGLHIPKYSVLTSRMLIIFFICILPANIFAAINYFDYQTATYTATGPVYLFFRVPLQILFIWWVYYFGVRKSE